MDIFKNSVSKLLAASLKLKPAQIISQLEIPPDPQLGDYAFPCFSLAKTLKKPPAQIAAELSQRLKPNKHIQEIRPQGPYVNFFVNKAKMAELTLQQIHTTETDYGKSKKSARKVIVEICSPNTNKPLHLGHLRNIFLGESVANIHKAIGYDVVKTCVINDRGIHIMKSMLSYQKWGKNKEPDKKPDHYVGDFYVLFNKRLGDNPELEEEAQHLLQKWESGDKETVKLWKKMNAWVYKGFDQTYKELGFKFDDKDYESKVYKKGKEIVEAGFKKGVFIEDDGTIIADLEPYGMTKKALVRSDGTSLYTTQDLYLAQQRYEKYQPEKQIYVVANEQNLHFQQLFKILELLGRKWASGLYHLNYGMVFLPEGRMKSREGTVVDADDIIAEMRLLAKAEIKKRHPDIKEIELTRRSKAIGDSALRFFMLKVDPYKDMVFDPEQSISFEGETGPYVQYTHARISSIIRKSKTKIDPKADFTLLSQEEEHALVRMLANYPVVVEDSLKHYKPSLICRYLLDLSQAFNEYYHKHKVLTDDKALSNARLLLIDAIRKVISNGLELLAIKAIERM